MDKSDKTRQQLLDELKDVTSRMTEAEETLRAILSGEVDGLVVKTAEGDRVFTLTGADLPYRVMVETMNEGAVTLAANGTILFCNQRFAEIVKRSLEEVMGSSIYRFIKPEEKILFEEFIRLASKSGRKEISLSAADGTSIPVLLSKSDLQKSLPGSICLLATDISELQEAQQALEESHCELELQVAKRTHELEVKAIQLEAANKELESFSYSVSHDLRAPLRAIDGFSRMLEQKYANKLEDDVLRRLTVIRANAQKMGQLIDHLLAFSRLGRMAVTLVEVDMRNLVEMVLHDIRDDNLHRQLVFNVNNMLPVLGDSSLLMQVLINLLSNAVKFSKHRAPAVIEMTSRLYGSEVVFCIKDNGAGFDMHYADKLFGVFQRLHSAEEYEGTGVGLAIVQRIIHRHGGRVWAEGKPNEGAAFYFTLPACKKADQ